MSSRALVNLLLLAGLVALALIALWEPGIEAPPPAQALTEADAATVETIEVYSAAGSTVRLNKVDGKWRVTEPFQLPANDFRVQSLLGLLSAPVQGTVTVAEGEMGRFGLDPAKASVTLEGRRFDFGTTEPIDGRRYVRAEGRVHLVDDHYYHHLAAGPTTWVSYKLLEEGTELIRLELPSLTLTRVDERWELEPEREDVGADAIQALVDTWLNAQAISVRKSEEEAQLGETTRLHMANGDAVSFQILRGERGVSFTRPALGIQYQVAQGTADRLLELDEHVKQTTPEPQEPGAPPQNEGSGAGS